MSTVDQLLAGLELTLTGMVTVFLLLAFMVLLIGWMSRLAHHLQPPARYSGGVKTGAAGEAIDPALVSVISAAVHRYRNRRR